MSSMLQCCEPTHVVDSALKLDLQCGVSRVVDFLPKFKRHTLTLVIIRDVLGRFCSIASLELSTVDLELMGIENQVTEAIVLGDLGFNRDCALVRELAAELEIVEGDVVVRRLRPVGAYVSLGID